MQVSACVAGCLCDAFRSLFHGKSECQTKGKLLYECQRLNDVYSSLFELSERLLYIQFVCRSYSVEQEKSSRQRCLKW